MFLCRYSQKKHLFVNKNNKNSQSVIQIIVSIENISKKHPLLTETKKQQ
jgi:hypothetical protein